MRRLPALVAALLLPATSPLLLGTAVVSATLLANQASTQAQTAEDVAKVAQAITVRIEGATQGSGVLVKRDGNRYTVLTAWHVVSGQQPGEELDIYTPDGQRHPIEQGSIKRIGEVDMALLSFISGSEYSTAKFSDSKSVDINSRVYVIGFPAGTQGRATISQGRLAANADVGIDQGYQLLYTNKTTFGFSGGPVLSPSAWLMGIHGRGELDMQSKSSRTQFVKTGINQGVPIRYYTLFDKGMDVKPEALKASTADDYIAQSRELLRPYLLSTVNECTDERGCGNDVIPDNILRVVLRLASQAISKGAALPELFNYRGQATFNLNSRNSGCSDFSKAIALDAAFAEAYFNRGVCKMLSKNYIHAIEDFSTVIHLDPLNAWAYIKRGDAKLEIGDKSGASRDWGYARKLNPGSSMFGL